MRCSPSASTSTRRAASGSRARRRSPTSQPRSRAISTPLRVAIQRLPGADDLPLPSYATAGAAGLDVSAALPSDLEIPPGGRALVPCGFAIAVPEGYEAQLRPRSGLALRHGLLLPNAPGTIDSDYRGEVKVIVLNAGNEPLTLRRGDRIAQLVFAPVQRVAWEECASLPETTRGAGGFGHTGVGAPGRDPA